MKKLIASIAVAALPATAALAWEASVYQTNKVNNAEFVTEWRYDLTDSSATPRTATLLWAKNVVSDVTIPNILADGVNQWTVTKIADRALANQPGLLSIEIPNSILEVGNYAFENCTALAKTTLGYGVRYIGKGAFSNTAVREIKIPDSLLDMGGNIAAGTLFSALIDVDDSSHFQYSEDGVLYNRDMTKLYACPVRAEGTIEIPDTVTNICADAFYGCHRLSSLELPESLSVIGSGAFNVKGIWPGLDAPESAPKLMTVIYKGSVPTNVADNIYEGAPAGLVSLVNEDAGFPSGTWKGRRVEINTGSGGGDEPPPTPTGDSGTDGVWVWSVQGGVAVLQNGGKSALVNTNTTGAVAIPTEVTDSGSGNTYVVGAIGTRALYGCRFVDAVTIPSTVESIGAEAFAGTRIATLAIPAYVETIEGNPAAGCPRFTGFSVAAGNIRFSSDDAGLLYDFRGEALLAVPARASEITVPASVKAIAADAFASCSVLTKVTYLGNAPTAEANLYAGTPDTLTSYVSETATGFTEGTWKERPIVAVSSGGSGGGDEPPPPGELCETIGGLTWYYRVIDGYAEIYRNGKTAVTSDSQIFGISLPDTLGGYMVKGVGDGALSDLRGIESIGFPSTYEWIGAYVCSNCTSLKTVSIPYGIRYIGKRAFVNTLIQEITVPDSLLDMGGNISAGTLFTSEIVIGDSSHFKYSDDGVLYNRDMTKLFACPTRAEGTITIPNTVTNIATDAFFGCHRISYLNLPATVNTIGEGAFNVAGIWPGLDAPESVPKLLSVFYNGPVPDAADDIFDGAPEDLVIYAFTDEWKGMSTWKGRAVLVLDSANPPVLSFTDENGITWFYRIANDEVEIYNEDASGNPTTAVSPASTSGIPYKESEDSIVTRKALKIPDAINGYAVTKIGAHAFDGCKALIYVGIPTSVREIGDGAFSGCASISAIGDSQSIPFGTADNTIDLPRGVTKLGLRPFEGIQASSVLLPYTLTAVDGNPVAGCDYVTSLSVDSSCPSFYSEGNIIYNKRKSTVIAVPANYDGSSASFLDSVTAIGDEALFGCKNIAKIQVPEALEAIGTRAFAGCESVKSLALPSTLATIGEAAFSGCSSLAKVTYAGNAPTAADDIYDGTPESLTSYANESASGFTTDKWKSRNIVIIPSGTDPGSEEDPGSDDELSQVVGNVTWYFRVVDGVAEIWRKGATAVSSSDPIMELALPTTIDGYMVKGVGAGALSNLRGITSVSIPSSYEWIDDGAFTNCTSLADVTLADGLRSIGKEPFAGTLISTLTIPAYVESIDGNPAAGCTRFTGFTVAADNINFAADDDGALYSADMSRLLAVPARATEATIPASVTAITDNAFDGCSALKKLTFLGNAPTAAEGLLADTPETLKITVTSGSVGWDGKAGSDALPASGLWRDRQVVADYAGSVNQEYDDGTVTWTYSIVKGKAVITGASGEAETVTVPATLGGYEVSKLNADALDELSGVKTYKSDSGLYMSKNGCLYSADGKTLVRVPDAMVLPYSVTTEVTSNIVTVTIIPGIKKSGNEGNDGTSVTTNIESSVSRRSTERVDGDISFETILDGVAEIGGHAFYGCNSSLTNETLTVSETLGGETGFTASNGDAYIRTTNLETTEAKTYSTKFQLPDSVTKVAANAFTGTTVQVGDPGDTPKSYTPEPGIVIATEPESAPSSSPAELAPKTSYAGWIEKDGKIVGTVSVKAGAVRNGALAVKGQVVRIGGKKQRVKSLDELKQLGEVRLFRDCAKSGTAAEKASLGRYNGKGWTLAFKTQASSPLLGGYTVLSVSAANCKAKISGFAADGTKISATAQVLVDGDVCRIPAAIQMYPGKKGGFAILLSVDRNGAISVDQVGDFTAVVNGKAVKCGLTPVAVSKRGGTLAGRLFLDDGIAASGYTTGDLAEWKPKLAANTGIFKGFVYLYRNSDGKRLKAKVNGVLVGGFGYGSAVLKNSGSWKVEVVPNAK